MIRLHIFDMDGTILDSMKMWERVCTDFAVSRGIVPDEDLDSRVRSSTFEEALQYMSDNYDLGDIEEVKRGISDYVTARYRDDLELFPGIAEDLLAIRDEGVPMVILTNSWRDLVDKAFTRHGILDWFKAVYTYEDLGVSKREPECFRLVCEKEGVLPSESLVHDDSDYALDAAVAAGCSVKIYDRYR